MAESRKQRWFELGRRSLSALYPDEQEAVYACPLCLGTFGNTEGLSIEHVPPAAVGGRPLVLTCRPCNNTSGGGIDAHWHRSKEAQGLFDGTGSRPVRGRLVVGEFSVPITATNKDGKLEVLGVPAASNPTQLAGVTQAFDAMGADSTFQIEAGSHLPRHAQISQLRAAYLAAFAKLGYRYALPLATVRSQLSDPSQVLISNFHLALGPLPEVPDPGLLVGESPGLGPCLVIRFGNEFVILPPPLSSSDEDFWTRVACLASESKRFSFTGGLIAWPTMPEFLLDDRS